ncbi:MAG: hypothetical protein KGL13_07490 [Gammaproteobacteria bacterium]|nr:hypothetical protein [Gammaproteobacteria bacterium]MDE2346296.1 hypothetical protein [Gammaproteobacteria bacterium]
MHPAAATSSAFSNIGFTLLIAALVLFVLYRRFRRLVGRQKLQTHRMIYRMAVLTIVCVVLLVSPFLTTKGLVAAAVGALVGLVLAYHAFGNTRFEATPEGKFYTPNLYIGLTLSALFIGRLIYRFLVLYPMISGAIKSSNPSAMAAYEHSPITLGLYFLLAGYYVSYYAGILRKSRTLEVDDGKNGRPRLIS